MSLPMVIIRVELLPKKEEIHNEMPLLLEGVSPSSRILIDILIFYSKSKACFSLLSFVYLVVRSFNLLILQKMNYLGYLYAIQTKISSYVQEKLFNNWYTACIDYYHNYYYDIWEARSTTIFFSDRSVVGGARFPGNSLPPKDHVMKEWEYVMAAYFLDILNPENPLFQSLTKFSKCMFKRIH